MKIGRLAENIWKRSVRKNLSTRDFKTVGTRMTMIPFSSRMGGIAVYDIVNSSLCQVSDIDGIVLSLMIDGRCSEEYVQHIVRDADAVAKKLCVKIKGFDIHIVQGLKKPFITGYSMCSKHKDEGNLLCPKSHEDIVIIKHIAMAGTVIITEDRYEELRKRFSELYLDSAKAIIDELSLLEVYEIIAKSQIPYSYMCALSEGGINGALWEMADLGNIGFEVQLKNIPIKQETVEVCNHFDINPYELTSSGALLVTTKDGQALVDKMNECGIEATIIGRTSSSNGKLINNEDEQRFLTIPATDGIYEIT